MRYAAHLYSSTSADGGNGSGRRRRSCASMRRWERVSTYSNGATVMRKLWQLLAATLVCALPSIAHATVCGTSTTLNTNGSNTANYGQNVVSSLNFPCLSIVDPTTTTQAMTVRAGSSAAATTDPAAVVQISPESPLLGTAGTASAEVLTIQGIASMTPVLQNQTDSSGNSLYKTDTTANQLVVCNQEAQYDTNTNGDTQMVALVSSKKIYVCGFSFFAAGTVSVNLTQGTGTNCATGTNTKMTPTYQLTTQTGIVDNRQFGALAGPNVSLVSQALCIQTNAAIAVQARVEYAQF